jgi:hypothetical protein
MKWMETISAKDRLGWSAVAIAALVMLLSSGLMLYPQPTVEHVMIALRVSSLTTALPFLLVFVAGPFGISGGPASQRRATIAKGKRPQPNDNFNLVGGNGRFYTQGKFKDICQDLGEFACRQETSRSLVAIAQSGHVILLVNDGKGNDTLYPHQFAPLL